MKDLLLLRGSAFYLGAMGALALLAPRPAAAGLKPDPTAFDVFATRTIGTALLALAIANGSGPPRRGMLLANLVLNAVLGGVDVAAIAEGVIARDAWRGVAVHGGLVAAFGWALRPGRSSRCSILARPAAVAGPPSLYLREA